MKRIAVLLLVMAVASGPVEAAERGAIPVEGSPKVLTPPGLFPLLGPLVARDAASAEPFRMYDDRFARVEERHFLAYLKAGEDNDSVAPWVLHNHYGALTGRLSWSIRNGLPYGRDAGDEKALPYARGRRILRRYLAWSKQNQYAQAAHNNTGLLDIEALYVLEGDREAWDHLHVAAVGSTHDPYGYQKLTNKNSSPREGTVSLQAFAAAHRLRIPFARSPANNRIGFDPSPGSWKAAGNRQIGWFRQRIRPDGSLHSPSHGQEAFLFNAWLATTALQWHGSIDDTAGGLDLAKRLMDHLIAELQRRGGDCLPYTSDGKGPAPDLAGYYPWPAAVLWQETHEAKYREFALQNLRATRQAYLEGVKQWNQTYSTPLAQGAQAVLDGARWRQGPLLRRERTGP